ncbi:MAG TPA: hypothetical protein VJH88_03915 [Candidatus Nanoarchaeia archaeon]|nr:hypothetical protein [Candidatus Nanoarchaeia archaeon]
MAKKLTEAEKKELQDLFSRMEGGIKFDGTACDLIKELRKPGVKLAL